MKLVAARRACLGLLFALLLPAVGQAADGTNRFPAQLLAFSAAKAEQAHQLAAALNLQVSPDIWTFFKCATNGDLAGVTNTFTRLKWRASQYDGSANDPAVSTSVWQTLIEVVTAYQAFGEGGLKYPLAFGQDIINSIPPGSIYFGGTDPGRGLVTALCKSQIHADPFFTLTQNALADDRYLTYLRLMYGRQIYISTTNDTRTAFTDYTSDARLRFEHDRDFPGEPRQVRPGEGINQTADGQIQVSGQVSVMAINALIVKNIFDHNPDREFYIEESFPLDWMYPYLSPHGLIFKLNRQPLPQLTPEMINADHAFWSKQCDPMLGPWLTSDMPLSNVCQFVVSVYVQKDYSHFTGDRDFVTDLYATKMYSKLRSSSGGLYQWRLANKTYVGDTNRLAAETDFAFRQSFALCPTSPEAIYRYINFLMSQNRVNDAILLVRTARRVDPDNESLSGVLTQLLNAREQQRRATQATGG